ncbi:TPA: hypothetical protein ACSCYS_003521 [Aeromonas veronii]
MTDTTILIITAAISGVAVVLGAAIPSLLQYRSKKLIEESEANKRRFSYALDDIEYLYALLGEYEQECKNTFGSTMRRELSQRVSEQNSLSWSGRHTPSRIAHYRKFILTGKREG